MNNYNKLLNNLEELKLDKIREQYPTYIEQAVKENKSITDMLYELTNKELEYKNEKANQIQVSVAAFPYKK